jgi:DNA-binding CsgD family transcriptional regulator
VKPQGILDVAEVILDRSMTTAATLAITRKTRDGYFDAEGVSRVQRLFPHVRRAVLIGQVLKLHRRDKDELANVIEGLAAGVFLVTKDGRILRTNKTGDEMLSTGSPVRADGNVLRFPDGAPKRALAEALKAAGGGAAGLGDKGVSIPLNGGTGFVAHILPLKRDTAQDAFRESDARIAVFIRSANPDQSRALETLAKTYSLTPAESRVARALVEVGSTPMIAEALGVTVATVRTHVRNLYQKTGCGRQSEIVSLLQGLVSPFG